VWGHRVTRTRRSRTPWIGSRVQFRSTMVSPWSGPIVAMIDRGLVQTSPTAVPKCTDPSSTPGVPSPWARYGLQPSRTLGPFRDTSMHGPTGAAHHRPSRTGRVFNASFSADLVQGRDDPGGNCGAYRLRRHRVAATVTATMLRASVDIHQHSRLPTHVWIAAGFAILSSQ
jgi:hypothetical protein